ncbi:hypothetical protein V1478_002989 [Vespula squamosa]|uniref:Uncharacterized protein n=1 Tax=Vespula squamosa TaxID=30214 RepID=A0ABD2BRE6_VESSQ
MAVCHLRRSRYTTTCQQSSRGFDAAGRVVNNEFDDVICHVGGDQGSDIPKLTDLEKREEVGKIRRRDITRTTLQSKGFMAQTEIPQTMAELIP